MAERSPGPFMHMSPAGLPGLMAVIVVAIGMWSLFGVAMAVRDWRERHPSDHSVLHLDSDATSTKGKNV